MGWWPARAMADPSQSTGGQGPDFEEFLQGTVLGVIL